MTKIFRAKGRRKNSVAVANITSGDGKIIINGIEAKDFVQSETLLIDLKQPLVLTETEDKFNINVKVKGGGYSGQVGAIRLAITRALLEVDVEYRKPLKVNGLITRDSRVKERKKYGLKKARRAPQFSKR